MEYDVNHGLTLERCLMLVPNNTPYLQEMNTREVISNALRQGQDELNLLGGPWNTMGCGRTQELPPAIVDS